MSIEAELIREIKALREAVECMKDQQERTTVAVEKMAAQVDNITSGGNCMVVEVLT